MAAATWHPFVKCALALVMLHKHLPRLGSPTCCWIFSLLTSQLATACPKPSPSPLFSLELDSLLLHSYRRRMPVSFLSWFL